jgi:hypothetical protein
MLTIRRTGAWVYDAYDPLLPPPLCFTHPAGALLKHGTYLPRPGTAIELGLRQPKLMMDPSDRSTWQRPYRFTS